MATIRTVHILTFSGSKSLKQEILDALCSVDNIPFFDKVYIDGQPTSPKK
jgi:hypothetical protein